MWWIRVTSFAWHRVSERRWLRRGEEICNWLGNSVRRWLTSYSGGIFTSLSQRDHETRKPCTMIIWGQASLGIKASSTTWTSNYSMAALEGCSPPLTAAQWWKISTVNSAAKPALSLPSSHKSWCSVPRSAPCRIRAGPSWKGAEAIWFLSLPRAGGIRAPEYFIACSNGKVKGSEEHMCAQHPTPGCAPHTRPECFVQPSR